MGQQNWCLGTASNRTQLAPSRRHATADKRLSSDEQHLLYGCVTCTVDHNQLFWVEEGHWTELIYQPARLIRHCFMMFMIHFLQDTDRQDE